MVLLNEKENAKLIKLLFKYMHCFASGTHELGCIKFAKIKINLTSDKSVHYQPYGVLHCKQAIVKSKVHELLAAGIIKESESSEVIYASPVILVKGKNGDSRLRVDNRALNEITVKNRFPLQNIDDQITKLSGKNYFTTNSISPLPLRE